jgi:uncharacterized protein YggE
VKEKTLGHRLTYLLVKKKPNKSLKHHALRALDLTLSKEVKMKNILIVSLIFFVCSPTVSASNIPDFPFIVVNGEAKIDVKPDIAEISIDVTEFNKDSESATNTVKNRGHQILQAANANGIGADSITSNSISKYVRRSEGHRGQDLEILGYEVSQNFIIKINSLEKYPAVVDKLTAMQNVVSLKSSFNVSKREVIISDLVKSACSNATKKANDLALGLGVKLGAVFAVTQDTDFTSITAVFGASELTERYEFMADMASTQSSVFIPKTITISKTVNVVYKLK